MEMRNRAAGVIRGGYIYHPWYDQIYDLGILGRK